MSELLQHIVVTIVAFGAGAMLVWRVVGFVGPGSSQSEGCPSCPSAKRTCDVPAAAAPGGEQPVMFIRPAEASRRRA